MKCQITEGSISNLFLKPATFYLFWLLIERHGEVPKWQ
jgi:hypothetical protein